AHDAAGDSSLERIALELLHVPGTVDLQMGPQLEEPLVRDQEGAAVDGKEGERPLVLVEVLAEQRKAVRIPFPGAGEAQEGGVLEGVRASHRGHRTATET